MTLINKRLISSLQVKFNPNILHIFHLPLVQMVWFEPCISCMPHPFYPACDWEKSFNLFTQKLKYLYFHKIWGITHHTSISVEFSIGAKNIRPFSNGISLGPHSITWPKISAWWTNFNNQIFIWVEFHRSLKIFCGDSWEEYSMHLWSIYAEWSFLAALFSSKYNEKQ